MLHVGVVVLGAYFVLLAVWSLTHTTARYYVARRAQADFMPTLTPSCPCCPNAHQPVEGLMKMGLAALLCLAEFSLDKGYEGDQAWLSRFELGTIYVFLLLSGAMDVLARWGARTFYDRLDYAGLGLFFLALAVVLETQASVTPQPASSMLTLAAYTATAAAIATAVEGVGVGGQGGGQVLAPVMRCYLLLLQGTWWLHGGVVTGMGRGDYLLSPASDPDEVNHAVSITSLLFCVHAGLSFAVVVCLWLLFGRLVERGSCRGLGGEAGGPSPTDVYLENRVRFNYHVLSRLDSESE